jgi:sugar phosphate isomerase/epimerase
MIQFTTVILKFDNQGEKTGWTYIEISADVAQRLKPNNKKSFRVKGKLDNYNIKATALIPMGGGNFIMALNADMRKAIGKRKGAMLKVQLQLDESPLQVNAELLECLEDEPKAKAFFSKLAPSHQKYYSNWIESAKTEPTRAKRIAQAINGFTKGMGYGELIRSLKEDKNKLAG